MQMLSVCNIAMKAKKYVSFHLTMNMLCSMSTTPVIIQVFRLIKTLSSLTLHCHLHPLQAANCCRNS